MSPERSTLFQGIQLGLEVTPGTAVAANKKLLATGFEIGANPDVSLFKPAGMKYHTIASLNREWTQGNISGQMSYTDLTYLLASLISTDTPATVETTGKEWVFTSNSSGADAPATYTIEQGSGVRAHEFAHCLVTGLTLRFNNSGTEVEGSFIGEALVDGITMTASPTEIALQPVMRTQVGFYLADTAAGLGSATVEDRVLSCEWQLNDRYAPVWTLNQSTTFDAVIESEPTGEMRFLMAADADGMGLLTTLRNGATKFARIYAQGPVIGAGPAIYELEIDTALKITGVSPFRDEEGIFAIEWTGRFAHDSTWGKAFQIRLVNALTTL